jgi:pimeloyl-ACP methyl ester carboxylesterase
MAVHRIARYVRPIEDVREDLVGRARIPTHPWPPGTQGDEAERIFVNIRSLDRDEWAAAFCAVAQPYEEQARAAEAAGNTAEAQTSYQRAYAHYRMARYPAPNSPGKRAAYDKSVETFLKAAQALDPPLERVVMPFAGRPGEGDAVTGYLRRPPGQERAPIVVRWGGIDTFKEEWSAAPYLARNLAMIAIDQPGTGQAPIPGSTDAERMFDAVFDWIGSRPDLDPGRVGLIGGSTGGYWAAKLAHTHRERARAVVDWGGCAHFAFTPEWIEQAQHGEYALELGETLACAFGRATFEEWVELAPQLSLLDQGILDQPCAPLLLINGTQDTIFPIADMYLLLEHGSPKTARFWPTGHMARTPQTEPAVLDWIERELKAPL